MTEKEFAEMMKQALVDMLSDRQVNVIGLCHDCKDRVTQSLGKLASAVIHRIHKMAGEEKTSILCEHCCRTCSDKIKKKRNK